MPKVTVHHDDFSDGEEFEVMGMGVFKNGEEKEVPPGNIQAYLNMGYAWPTDDPDKDVVVKVPPEPPKDKDLEPDAIAKLDEETLAKLAGEKDEKENK